MTAPLCPFCGDRTIADEVDIGVGTIRGPEGCTTCHAYENDDREWQPPDPEYLPAALFDRLMLELLLLRGVEDAARPFAAPHAVPASSRLHWRIERLNDFRRAP